MQRFTTPLLAALLAAWTLSPPAIAEDRNGTGIAVVCGAGWVTFELPGISEAEREEIMKGVPLANHAWRTMLTIRKRAVRNLVFYAHTGGGEVVFFLETGSVERPRAPYSALVTEPVYRDVLACLNTSENP